MQMNLIKKRKLNQNNKNSNYKTQAQFNKKTMINKLKNYPLIKKKKLSS